MSKIITTNYYLNSIKINNTKIVLLTDIHYYQKKDIKKLELVIKYINKSIPQYICISGDLIDQCYILDEQFLLDWLKKISSLATTIISIGNHEFRYSKKNDEYDKKLYDKIRSIPNIYVLDNETYVENDICFIGLTIPDIYYKNEENNSDNIVDYINKIDFKLKQSHYNVLMTHSPISITKEEVLEKIKITSYLNLVLCGHMHGGITPKFLKPYLHNRGLIGPEKKLFPKNAYGHILKKDINFIISSGIIKASHLNPFRFLDIFFSPEITNIEIESK